MDAARHRKSKSAPNTTKDAENVQKIVEKRVLPKELLGATENSTLRYFAGFLTTSRSWRSFV